MVQATCRRRITRLYGFETHLRDFLFQDLLNSFQMENNDDMWVDSNKVSKSLKFFRREKQFTPSVRTCMVIKYGSKLVYFIRMRVPIYVILKTSDQNSYLKNKHEYF